MSIEVSLAGDPLIIVLAFSGSGRSRSQAPAEQPLFCCRWGQFTGLALAEPNALLGFNSTSSTVVLITSNKPYALNPEIAHRSVNEVLIHPQQQKAESSFKAVQRTGGSVYGHRCLALRGKRLLGCVWSLVTLLGFGFRLRGF